MNSNDIAIRVAGLGKMYRLGRAIPHASTLTGKMRQTAAAPFQWLISQLRAPAEDEILWALKDVSFEVKRGEVVGIIGHNGAGKSTLLKILSRITEPTNGFADIHGRIAALLEVGTGMHPELTGRENIYMNGTVLGMKKREIDAKFDEIVEFSEIEKFLDTPVKRYSSGMRVRLGFAIAAHLEPEILVVDEVLAVGDLNFQKKCLGKMEEVASTGRTVLFVSHRMEAIRVLCNRAILLNHGELIADGATDNIVEAYHRQLRQTEISKDIGVGNPKHRRGSGAVRFTNVAVMNRAGEETFSFEVGQDICFKLSYEVITPVKYLCAMVGLRSSKTMEMVTTSKRHNISEKLLQAGSKGEVMLILLNPNVRPGEYPLYFGLADNRQQAYDVMDDLTSPLAVTANGTAEDLGYDPTKPCGYFNIESEMRIETMMK